VRKWCERERDGGADEKRKNLAAEKKRTATPMIITVMKKGCRLGGTDR
jgi:hypothetical protein